MLQTLSHVNSLVVYLIVGGLVFAEDAIFVGFVLPGETAAVLGGVVASRGNASIAIVLVVVVAAAIIGDTVGYEVGHRLLGPTLLQNERVRRHQHQVDRAQDLLARRGGWAVFLGRFTAFFRAMMPALAGAGRMPYRTFVTFNALGGIVWGVAFVLIGYLAGNSYARIQQVAGRTGAAVVVLVVLAALILWRVRRHRFQARENALAGSTVSGHDPDADHTEPTSAPLP